ncbi:MAG: helix-turn-helix domain-containing protein [Actinomycetota bacterium]|nr:helix-turn-helix domain-containing protein [Actinomycetota bacterium]
MNPATTLRNARRAAGLSQRELARRAQVAQPAVARIESGGVVPRIDTLDGLLRACGYTLEVALRAGSGVDRSVIRQLLQLTPRERLDLAVAEAHNLDRLIGGLR